jgi:hypothetical protein
MFEIDIELSDQNFDDLFNLNGSVYTFRWEARNNGQVRIQGNVTISGDQTNASIVGSTSNKKFAATFTSTQIKVYTDGVLIGTFNGSYGIDFDTIGNNVQQTAMREKQILLFPTALTDSECIALTTI